MIRFDSLNGLPIREQRQGLRRGWASAAALAALATLGGCATPVGPVEVTRFSAPERIDTLARGTISVEPAPGMDEDSLELRSYEAAVARELVRLGYREVADGTGEQVALVRVDRGAYRAERSRGPVSVGVGGSTGGWYGGGVGVGVGIDLSGPPPERVETQLSVTIRKRATDQAIWEGRASFEVKASSPLAETQLAAARLAEALFTGFPGESGETIEVE